MPVIEQTYYLPDEKYPQIKKLFGYDPNFKWVVTLMVLVQIISLPFVVQLSWPLMLVVAYCFGGVINHSLMLAIHEIAHNLAFGHNRPLANKLFGFFANLPIGLPVSISFKKYHLEHHRYQGDEVIDTDLPTLLEAKLFCTTGGKLLWLFLQPLFYSFRPLIVRPKNPTPMELINLVIQLFFDAVIIKLWE
uniref:SFRICE_025210 n=1 Tax=Spodoptera frugiperda TaxID=7108 RepID=A0A2H1WGD8_SPOFR